MKIEAGKYYRTRDGRKVGPIVKDCVDGEDWMVSREDGRLWTNGGRSFSGNEENDLIAEWTDEPTHQDIGKLTLDMDMPPDFAALAAQHRIKITVQVGEVIVEYDGRV